MHKGLQKAALRMTHCSNPIARVDRRPVQGHADATPLPYLEVKARLATIDRATLVGTRDYALLVVGLQTGRRLSKLAGMRDMSARRCWMSISLAGELTHER